MANLTFDYWLSRARHSVSAKARVSDEKCSCIRYLMDCSKPCRSRGWFSVNCQSSTIVYGLFYRNIWCTRTFGTLWRMGRQCVSGPLFGPGDKGNVFVNINFCATCIFSARKPYYKSIKGVPNPIYLWTIDLANMAERPLHKNNS